MGAIYESYLLPKPEDKIAYGPCIPNWSGTRFYRRGILKTFWKGVYGFLKIIKINPRGEKRLQKAVLATCVKTDALFRDLERQIEVCNQGHQSLLFKKDQKLGKDYLQAKQFLRDFNDLFGKVDHPHKLYDRLESIFQNTLGNEKGSFVKSREEVIKSFEAAKKMAPLGDLSDALSGREVPYSIFADLANGETLQNGDRVAFNVFIRQVSRRKKQALIPLLRSISIFTDESLRFDEREARLSFSLMRALKKEGVDIHKIQDRTFSDLKKTIGLKTYPDSKGNLKSVEFIDEEEGISRFALGEKEMLIIGNHPAHLPYLFERQRLEGVPFAPPLSKGAKGEFWIVPRGYGNLFSTYQKGDQEFKQAFETRFFELISLWDAKNCTPSFLDLAQLFTTKEGDLFTLSLWKMDKPFNVMTIEAFLKKLAGNDEKKLKQLIEDSGIDKRPMYRFFNEWAEHVLTCEIKDTPKELHRFASWSGVISKEATAQAQTLGEDLVKIKASLCKRHDDTKEVEKALIEAYRALGEGSAIASKKRLKAKALEILQS